MNRQLLLWVSLFAVAFAFVETSVVAYLRDLYYPNGFSLPLKPIRSDHILVELAREFSTIVMLVAVGWLAGRSRWQRMAWFMIAFGIWDIFYYVWLKVVLDWPNTILDWDVLFLIPIPWIGPVLAPVMISILLISAGVLILKRDDGVKEFRPPRTAWILALAGSGCVLYTFMRDTGATMEFQSPDPYCYWLFFLGIAFFLAGMITTFRRIAS